MSIFPQLEIKLPDFSLILKYHFPLTVSWPVVTLGVVNWVHSYRQVGMKKMSDKLPNFFWSARCCLLIYRLKNKALSQPHLCPIFATLRIVWTRLFLWQTEFMHKPKMTYIKGHKRSFFKSYMTFMHQNRFLMFNVLLQNMVHLHVKYVHLVIIIIQALLVIKEIPLYWCFWFTVFVLWRF